MKAYELPEKNKRYTLSLSDKRTFAIEGETKENIVKAKAQFVQLPDGSIVNKSHIVSIAFEKEETVSAFKSLPEEKRRKLLGGNSLRIDDGTRRML